MTHLYAESSAVLRWLLGTPDAAAIRRRLLRAPRVASSALTSGEVGRTLQRLTATGVLSEADRERAWRRYSRAAATWIVHEVTEEIISRAAESFPIEPLRTLDAIHLATALSYSSLITPVRVLSTDQRLRENARALGMSPAP